jgi:hypothetical protein
MKIFLNLLTKENFSGIIYTTQNFKEVETMRADKKLAAATLASLALFGAQKAVQAKAVMVPFVAIGGGWQTIVSYAHDSNLSTNTLHIAYNIKRAVEYGPCLHSDGYAITSRNDLTSFFIDGSTNLPPAIYAGTPSPYDNTGGTYAPVSGSDTYFGFMVVATEDAVGGVTGGAVGLAVDTISFNAGMRFLYAQRSINVDHSASAAGLAVAFNNTGLTANNTTKFMSFAPKDSNPFVYAVGVATNAVANLFGAPYAVPLALTKQNNIWWGRREDSYSDNTNLLDYCVSLWPVCAPSSAPTQGLLSNLNCQTGSIFATVGGWFHLQNNISRVDALITVAGLTVIATGATGQVITFKVESNTSYGYAVTPLHPIQYTTE